MAGKLTINSTAKMASGHEIPLLGFGVYKTPPQETSTAVSHALRAGYRHIDSAIMYQNESDCAIAMKSSGISREEIFLTSKVSPAGVEGGYDVASKLVDESLEKTGLEFLDLFLLHAPSGKRENRNSAWRALVEAQKAGKVRSVGISNYGIHHLQELEAYQKECEAKEKGSGGVISVAQYELHPWCRRKEIVEWCKARKIVLEAYCPVVRGQRFDDPFVVELAKKYEKTPAQILVRWSLQMEFVPLPKSVTPERIVENSKVFDFELEDSEVQKLGDDGHNPCAWDPTVWKE